MSSGPLTAYSICLRLPYTLSRVRTLAGVTADAATVAMGRLSTGILAGVLDATPDPSWYDELLASNAGDSPIPATGARHRPPTIRPLRTLPDIIIYMRHTRTPTFVIIQQLLLKSASIVEKKFFALSTTCKNGGPKISRFSCLLLFFILFLFYFYSVLFPFPKIRTTFSATKALCGVLPPHTLHKSSISNRRDAPPTWVNVVAVARDYYS